MVGYEVWDVCKGWPVRDLGTRVDLHLTDGRLK